MIGVDVLEELYGADPGEFVAVRTRLVKAAREAGDRETATRIGELRKPTLAAWAVNRLVRDRPAEVEALFTVGVQMREATAQLDVTRLRDLRADRDRVLDSFTRAARFVADAHGHPLSLDATGAVRATGVAALADEAAADAVAGGALVRTLDYAGFGEVDISDAVAAQVVRAASRPAPAGPAEAPPAEAEAPAPVGRRGDVTGDPVAPTRDDAAQAARDEARAEAEAARRQHAARLREEHDQAEQDLARLSLVEADAVTRAEKAHRRLDELSRLLDAARAEAAAAERTAEDAARERADAAATLEDVRARLDALDGE